MMFKVGDKVRYKNSDGRRFTIYKIFSKTKVSLTMRDYLSNTSRYLTDVGKIEKL